MILSCELGVNSTLPSPYSSMRRSHASLTSSKSTEVRGLPCSFSEAACESAVSVYSTRSSWCWCHVLPSRYGLVMSSLTSYLSQQYTKIICCGERRCKWIFGWDKDDSDDYGDEMVHMVRHNTCTGGPLSLFPMVANCGIQLSRSFGLVED